MTANEAADETTRTYNSEARIDSSWEDNSFCDSHNHSYGNYDSEYNSISFEQSVSERMDSGLCASDEDSDSKGDPREGKPRSEYIEEEAALPPHLLSCPLSGGSITALWVARTSGWWHQQMQTAATRTNSLLYSWVPSAGPVHVTTSHCGQGNTTSEANKQRRGQQSQGNVAGRGSD